MVVPLGPGKFYDSGLLRPCFYTDVKLNSERVDPPPSVTDPLMEKGGEEEIGLGSEEDWGCCGDCRRRNQKLAAVVEDALIGFGAKVFDDLSRWD
ncbi:hypothetical protein SASPL_128288 [Salvia splendens]|uniref:Uncharacterized protein n=1 Tax=Salvia splendens TaxID=180675 RepID=A0A8X8X982_SALSN|nr:hypothetical protein SASPL_128288 [Salvia splendens]